MEKHDRFQEKISITEGYNNNFEYGRVNQRPRNNIKDFFLYKHKFLDDIQQFATKMVSTCNLTKQAYLYTIKRTIENLKTRKQ